MNSLHSRPTVLRVVLAAMITLSCGTAHSDKSAAQEVKPAIASLPTAAHAEARAPAPMLDSTGGAVLPAGMLRFADIPASARAVLRDSFPTFQPYDPERYSALQRRLAHPSADEGFTVIRGAFRKDDRIDYILAGAHPYTDAGKEHRGFLVIALLAQPDGTYRPSPVSEGDDSSERNPISAQQVLLALDPRFAVPGKREFLLHLMGNARTSPERWVWVPERHSFLLDQPND